MFFIQGVGIVNEYNKKVGTTIRELRKRKNMLQRELCRLEFADEICTVRHLHRIEAGKVAPTATVLYKLLETLGVSTLEFANLVDGQDMRNFQHDFSEIWDLWFHKQYERAIQLLETLKTKSYCNLANSIVRQALLLYDGLILLDVKKEVEKCLCVLQEAISITAPCVLKKNDCDFEFISR